MQLRGDVMVSQDSSGNLELILPSQNSKSLVLSSTQPVDTVFLNALRTGLSLEEKHSWLQKKRPRQLCKVLREAGFLKESVDVPISSEHRSVEWLSHFYSDAIEKINSLHLKKVLLVGCGGTGAVIAQHLVRSGVRNFVLIDGGQIDTPDLNRQLPYYPNQIGLPKVEALKADLLKVCPQVESAAYYSHIQSSELLLKIALEHSPDLIINCADTPVGLIHAWVAEVSLELNVASLFGGVGLEDSTLGPLLVSREAKKNYIQAMQKYHLKLKDFSNIIQGSISFSNSLVAVQLAFEAFRFLVDPNWSSISDKSKTWNFITAQTMAVKDWV